MAVAGQGQAPPITDEQRTAQCIFERADMAADRAVGDVQFPGRLADAAQAGGGFEGTEGIQ